MSRAPSSRPGRMWQWRSSKGLRCCVVILRTKARGFHGCTRMPPARRFGRESGDVDIRSCAVKVGLVLGAGGVLGGAWLVGALHALAEETGWDPGSADYMVGTSAG